MSWLAIGAARDERHPLQPRPRTADFRRGSHQAAQTTGRLIAVLQPRLQLSRQLADDFAQASTSWPSGVACRSSGACELANRPRVPAIAQSSSADRPKPALESRCGCGRAAGPEARDARARARPSFDRALARALDRDRKPDDKGAEGRTYLDVLVRDGLDIEADGRYRRHLLVELELVEDS